MRFSPTSWKDYELIDSGDGEKLERFGDVVLIRPETAAIWPKSLSSREWSQAAHGKFIHKDKNSGYWKEFQSLPKEWTISYPFPGKALKFKLQLTKFKHVGIFPEHGNNWDYIHSRVAALKEMHNNVRVLNLFAYTGGASLAARAAGAEVTHVDSIRQVVSWSRENMELSGLDNIRWTIEDALKFTQREAKRGNKYHGIMMDPPSWGLGPKGEKWRLEDKINELLQAVSQILEKDHFLIINTYSGLSPVVVENLASSYFKVEGLQSGELCLLSAQNRFLPLGTVVRFDSL